MVIGKAAGVQAIILDEILYGVSASKGNEEESLKETESKREIRWRKGLKEVRGQDVHQANVNSASPFLVGA